MKPIGSAELIVRNLAIFGTFSSLWGASGACIFCPARLHFSLSAAEIVMELFSHFPDCSVFCQCNGQIEMLGRFCQFPTSHEITGFFNVQCSKPVPGNSRLSLDLDLKESSLGRGTVQFRQCLRKCVPGLGITLRLQCDCALLHIISAVSAKDTLENSHGFLRTP